MIIGCSVILPTRPLISFFKSLNLNLNLNLFHPVFFLIRSLLQMHSDFICSRKLLKMLRQVTTGEILTHYKQFLLLPQCFQPLTIIALSFTDFQYNSLEVVCCWFIDCWKGKPADAFWHNSSRRLWKTLWPKVKLFMMSNFSCDQCFQLLLTIKLFFIEIFQDFVTMFSKLTFAVLLYVGKG